MGTKSNSILLIFAIVLVLGSLGQVASDLYLPSIPRISVALNTSVNWVQLSISLYLLGFSISQLIYGPISDGVGRKKPLLTGISILFIGSLVCVTAHSITLLIIGRFLQGLGAGSGLALSRAILRDKYSGQKLAKLGSYLGSANVAIMASAPLLGGYLQDFFGWRASFAFITLYTLVTLGLILFFLPETNQHLSSHHLKLKQLRANLALLLKNRCFVGCVIVITCTYGAILAWLTAGTVLLQKTYGLSAIAFGWVAFAIGAAYIIGGLINAQLLNFFSSKRLIIVGVGLMASSGLALFLITLLGIDNVWSFSIAIFILIYGSSLIFANIYAIALTPFPKIAGIAGSVSGSMQILGGTITSGILAYTHDTTPLPLSIVLVIVTLVSLTALGILVFRSQQIEKSHNIE